MICLQHIKHLLTKVAMFSDVVFKTDTIVAPGYLVVHLTNAAVLARIYLTRASSPSASLNNEFYDVCISSKLSF